MDDEENNLATWHTATKHDLYELAEVLSIKCTNLGRNEIFPSSYAFASKTF